MSGRFCPAGRARSAAAVLLLAALAVGFAQWDAEQRITSNTSVPDLTTTGNARAVAISGSTVQLVYHEQPSILQAAVYHTRSTDNGVTWSSRFTLSGTGTFLTAMFGTVAVNGATVHAAWMELDMLTGLSSVKYRRSTDAGASWLSTQTITSVGTLNEVPSLAVNGSTVHVVWDDGGSALYYRRSTDGGASWGTTLTLASGAATGCVAASGSTVLVSYSLGSGSAWDIYLRRSTDGGASFGSAQLIENAGTLADISSLALQGANAVIVWYDNGSGTYDVRYRRSTDGGATWATGAGLGAGPGAQEAPCVAAGSAGQLNAVYEDNSYGNYEIVHKYSTDWGVSWSAAYRVTTASNTSQRPTIAMTGTDTVAVAWTDGRYNEANPDVFFRRGVIVTSATHDVGCTRILAPTGTADSGAVVTPACSVYNYGSAAETYKVRMRIGPGYDDSATVTSHAPATYAYVTFPSWTALARGTNPVTCSTRLAGDVQASNDKRADSVLVRVIDAEVVSITTPTDSADSGQAVAPQATVRNNGTAGATFNATFTIGTWSNTQTVTLPAGASQNVSFGSWTPVQRGSNAVKCTTQLASDMKPGNDKKTGTVFVRVRDAQAQQIVAPGATADSGLAVQPQARVANNGNTTVSFNVTFGIGGAYNNMQPVSNLAPGANVVVSFAGWTPTQRGTFATACTTALTGDMVPANNTVSGSVDVLVHDIGVVAIVRPRGALPPAPIAPQATVHNWGNRREASTVTFRINSSPPYAQTLTFAGGLPFADTTIDFPGWTPSRGSFAGRCSTWQALEQRPGNDTASVQIAIGNVDLGISAIVAPSGRADTASPVVPQAWVRNYGELAASGTAWFFLDSGATRYYSSSRTVGGLAAGDSVLVGFDTWPKPHAPRRYATRCSAYTAYDGDSTNNTRVGEFTVYSRPGWPLGWHEVRSIPLAPSGRAAKDGAWLAFDVRTGLLYLCKGNKTGDFYSYEPYGDTWHQLASIPPGSEGKAPGKGAAGCTDGEGAIYATKGNNTQGFWKYDALANTWTQKRDVPLGPSNKRVKGGTDIVFSAAAAPGSPFLLKGYRNEFWRYDTEGDSWSPRANAPVGANVKWDKGSWLASDGGDLIWAHKAKYHEFYRYDVTGNAWSPRLPAMPIPGSAGMKKSKDGGSATWTGGAVYAFKGGNTLEFWRYLTAADSWKELESIPGMGSTARKKKVKAGADLAAYDNGALFALKGNKCLEFWRYAFVPPVSGRGTESRDGVASSVSDGRTERLAICPNPFSGDFAMLRGNLPRGRTALVSVYDATGRSVLSRAFGNGPGAAGLALDLRHLGAGVYLVKLSCEGFAATQKLVVQK